MAHLPRWIGALGFMSVLGLAAALISAPGPTFTTKDKAYYADANLLNFIRPGLVIKVISHEIASDGTVRARVRLTDAAGAPLDRQGIVTPGSISTSFILAHIPAGQLQYTAFTTRVQTSPITNLSATQAAADSGGSYQQVADGEYVYTFGRKVPADAARNLTYAIGVYGSRNLSEFDLPTNYDDDVYKFVPDNSKAPVGRDVVATATCNKCHDPLAEHGGSRRSVELCAMCHSPQTSDPDTGNTVDLKVMVHKIHMGEQLPSVEGGKPYVIIGNSQSVHDYSEVVFPADPRRCKVCHDGTASQSDRWYQPSRAACGSCHDDVNFATGEGHVGLPQVSDNLCASCHIPQGEIDFDASIQGAHMVPEESRHLPGTVFEILRVTDGSAGKRPTITFSLKDKSGTPILPSQMNSFRLTLAGPTTDYSSYLQEDVRLAQGQSGEYNWTFQNPIPANATGSFGVTIEGYREVVVLPGTTTQMTIRDAGRIKTSYFSVDGSAIEPRRKIVDIAKCNNCHASLSLHGSNRNQVEACVQCHNPNQTDAARRPAADRPAETVDFRTMIHKIHSGPELNTPYIVYGFNSTKFDFSHVGYPGDRRNCDACHVNGSQNPPLGENLLPVVTPRGYVNPTQPATAACTSCHDSRDALSHALVNTSSIGESCGVCHGSEASFNVDKIHAR